MSGNRGLTIQTVQQQLTALTPEFAKSLPPGMTPERFGRVALTAIQNAPALLRCEPQSLWNACMKAAQDGLLPDGREGAMIPRGNTVSWQPMVFGIITKAKRRGSVANLVSNIVYEGEPFEVLLGDDDRIVHRRDIARVKRGKEIAVYAIATLKDGSKEREVMTWDEIQAVRKMSSTPNAGPWVSAEGEMARKTVLRRLSKRLPALDDDDDDLRQAVERVDELYPFGKPAPSAPATSPPAPVIEGTVAAPENEPPTDLSAPSDPAMDWAATLVDFFTIAKTPQRVAVITKENADGRARLRQERPELADQVDEAERVAIERVAPKPAAADDDGWPGPDADAVARGAA